jgi:hypothetical protein
MIGWLRYGSANSRIWWSEVATHRYPDTLRHWLGDFAVHLMGPLSPRCPRVRGQQFNRLPGRTHERPVSHLWHSSSRLRGHILRCSGGALPTPGMALNHPLGPLGTPRWSCRGYRDGLLSRFNRAIHGQEDLLVVHRSSRCHVRPVRNRCDQYACAVQTGRIGR